MNDLGPNFVRVHLNRALVGREQEGLSVTGPGRGGPAVVAPGLARGHLDQVSTRSCTAVRRVAASVAAAVVAMTTSVRELDVLC